jgi:ABC-type polar amino acid transport system ATPase subunit
MEKIIEVQHLSKAFGTNEVLKDIDFSVNKGEVVCIIGSSGSGKSTLLRCINLLEKPSGGQIFYKGKNILDDKHDVRAYRAKLGMVFQQFNLFNNHDALRNCMVECLLFANNMRKSALIQFWLNTLKTLACQGPSAQIILKRIVSFFTSSDFYIIFNVVNKDFAVTRISRI